MKIIKRLLIGVVAFFVFMTAFGFYLQSRESKEMAMEAQAEKQAKESFDKAFADGSAVFYSSVRNDVTGKWRQYVCSTKNDFTEFAKEYYETYFADDEEIHFIVNLALKTTTRISKTGGMLDLTVHEYVDGEEHDAKKLAGGPVISQVQITL